MSTSDQLATLVTQLKERRALTFQDKLKSLDIRDEIWRKYIDLNKGSTIDATAAQRTGLCTDMCCERERITRECQRLFNPYEFDSDTRALNQSLMVTQYSRASADQAMPSAYDLRSGPVLLQTMNYLITNIMDKFDQDREQADWYNFLWDRLRAIRKEITQQHLRDETAIEILEQCARFHIFCSAFLSEYSRDAFDPNLNMKMLIDCLNQLRDCYLTHKQQNNYQALKNVAEFSSYMLLINLKDDNETLLRIRRLIQDITHISEVQVALNIHRSLLLNNTTKFFSLIANEATLLQSCILHRYFHIIRLKRLHSLVASTRPGQEISLTDLTHILGMDNDDETKDYLEQLGYSITGTSSGMCFTTPTDNQNQQEQQHPTNRLSQKLVKSKFHENLKDIITGRSDTPVVIPDINVEDSFDLQGSFIGKIPFDIDSSMSLPVRRPLPPTTTSNNTTESRPQQKPISTRIQPAVPTPRPLMENALRSLASTTTANPFAMSSRIMSAGNIFVTATSTTATPTVTQSPFRFGGFGVNRAPVSRSDAPNPFTQSTLSTRLFDSKSQALVTSQPTLPTLNPPNQVIRHLPSPIEPVLAPNPPPKTPLTKPDLVKQPPVLAPPVARRLSTSSMDTFIDELYEQLIDPLVQETACQIFDELISQWNKLTTETVKIFNELLSEEIISIATEYHSDIALHEKMYNDTIMELYERKRKKYLTRKYFVIWLENSLQAREERLILQDLQLKYHFPKNEQLLEFLTGLQLISEHDLTVEQAADILKSRRYLKQTHLKTIERFSTDLFQELLHDELQSIVRESNQELELRQKLLTSSLEKQAKLQRERYLRMKYISLWLRYVRRRRKERREKYTTSKRVNESVQRRSNKKLKENSHQYQTLKSSFDQLATDLNQIQLFIDKLTS
ncbi:unnamed protein product [Adineta ricciae]|uniref:SAC3/GANP/THP3 conserved domain-containing protein n=1 Tax=Adineta ricciae TaxID=249248 RepID=A0A813RV58_ADIRI|nr:unnamed protein product [Adineta ricciae]CAF1412183.1 unnamed protein product [Adineta ricciae]